MIVEQIMAAKQRKRRLWPVNTNRASELGHPCLRYLVFARSRGDERSLPSVNLQLIFDLGNMIEELVLQELQEAGVAVVEQQRPFDWKKYLITGHIDGKILQNGQTYPLEIKSISPYLFDSINDVKGMMESRYIHLRKYPAQLTLYMLMDNQERGLFLFKNKTSGQYKEVWMDLDYELGESLLKKAEAVNQHITDGTVPEPEGYKPATCNFCSFAHICNVERIGTEVEIVDDAELSAMLDRLSELKESRTEYEALDKQITSAVKNRPKVLVGDWLITGQEIKRAGFVVTDSVYWKKKITRVEDK